MRVALIVPGGLDRSLEYRVIPALMALISRLSLAHDVEVITLNQQPPPGQWRFANARIHSVGPRFSRFRALLAILRLHRKAPFDVVHAIWSGSCGMIGVIAGLALRIPSVVHVAGGELVWMPEIGYGGARSLLRRKREIWTLRHATAVSAASRPMIDLLGRMQVTAQRIPLGVDLASWPARPPASRDTRAVARLIHVASLNQVKDQTTLLRALASLRDAGTRFEMAIIGEDTLNQHIHRLSTQLGLDAQVRFLGFRTQRQLRPMLEAADLLVMSSRHETGPLVMLEAAVVGVPSVGTSVGHFAEWAPDAALAVPIGDSSALAHAIRAVLLDEDLRLRIANEAFKIAVRESAEYTARAFTELYQQVCDSRSSTSTA